MAASSTHGFHGNNTKDFLYLVNGSTTEKKNDTYCILIETSSNGSHFEKSLTETLDQYNKT